MITTTHVKHLLLGKKISRTGTTATDPSVSTYIVDGETVVTTPAGVILDSTTVLAQPAIVVVQSQGATKPTIKSDIIERKNVTAYKAKVAVRAVEQVSAIGYDGVTSTLKIDAINSNQYLGRILMQGEQNTFGNRDMYKTFEYLSDASATQSEIATGLQISLINNFKKMPDRYAKFEVVASATSIANTAASGTVTAVYGSTVLTCSGGTPSTDFIAGGFIRFAAAVAGGVAPVYKIASVDDTGNGTITLEVPYQGASAAFTVTNVSSMTAAIGDAGNFGIKITGVAKTFSAGKFRYYKNRWKIQLTDAGTTNITYTTGAQEGSGTTEQIQELEWFVQDGNMYRVSVPPFTQRANAVTYLAAGSGTGWSMCILNYFDQSNGGIGSTEKSLKELIIGAVTTDNTAVIAAGGCGTNMAGAATSIMEVLDAWLSTGTGAPGFTTQLSIV